MSSPKNRFEKDVDLRNYTSIKIGGRAKYFYTALSPDCLRKIVENIGSDFYLLGKGSNLLIKDCLIQKPIIKLGDNFSFIRPVRHSILADNQSHMSKGVKKNGNYLEVGASTFLSSLIKYCLEKNLLGLENLAGIPATIGGLLAMNAASFGRSISAVVEEVTVMSREGDIKKLKSSEITFGYRSSTLEKYIILEAKFKLFSGKNLKRKIRELLEKRINRQDFNFPSCGCVFKNTPEFSAGFLIDSCRLKGELCGDAQVSPRHANFIINLGSAKYKDIIYLIQKIKDQIYKKYSIILEEEIKRWE